MTVRRTLLSVGKTVEGPSPHFSWRELACRDGTPYPHQWRSSRAICLTLEAELLRRVLGSHPLIVSSAYRSPSHNRAVGGAPRSQHLHGRALDLLRPGAVSLEDFHSAAIDCARWGDTRIRFLILYPWGIHMDIRSTKRLRIMRMPDATFLPEGV